MNKNTQKKLLDIVKNNYNCIAKNFNQTRKKEIWPVLLELTKNVRNNDKVLDAGCGNGRLLHAFDKKSIDYTGFDSSTELIKLAQENFPDKNFILNDIINMPNIKDKSFDWIFSIAVLHHIPGKKLRIKTLKNLRKKIKPDGKIVITVWNLWEHKDFKSRIIKFFLANLFKKNKVEFGDIIFDWKGKKDKKQGKERYYHAFTIKSFEKIVLKSSLKIEEIKKDKFNYCFILVEN